mgnify:CR=1 FL=1
MIAGQPIADSPISETLHDITTSKVNPDNNYYNGSVVTGVGPLVRTIKHPTANNIVNTIENRLKKR